MNSLNATQHTLNFNALSFDKFEEMCLWLVDDSGEYETVEHYGGTGDKNRDVVGYSSDGELDYFQCKRYEGLNFGILKTELDNILQHVNANEIKKPRRIYFVLSSSLSAQAKDKLKQHAVSVGLVEPIFWEPVILDKKIKKNPEALKNFFGIVEKREDIPLPQVDTTGLIAVGTQDTTFMIVNHGDVTAVDCEWSLLGFGWPGYSVSQVFDLDKGEKKELRIAMSHDFMGMNPIKEFRLHFKFRDSKNNWYFSERFLNPELVGSGAFYRINAIPGNYVPTRPFTSNFNIVTIYELPLTGLNQTRLVTYSYNGTSKSLKINISTTLSAVWQFTQTEIEAAFRELSERKIAQMIQIGKFEDDFYVSTYLKPTQETGFEAYKELRDSISKI